MRARPALLLLLAACAVDPDPGTAVGNPTGLTFDTAPGTAVSIDVASAAVGSILTTTCAGEERIVGVDGTVNLLGSEAIDVLLADACAVRVAFVGPLHFEGQGPDGSSFTLDLVVDAVEVTLDAAPGELPRAVLRLGSDGWVSDSSLGLTAGASVVVSAGDPLHDTLVDALVSGAALYPDTDEDGRCVDDCDDDDALGGHEDPSEDTGEDETGEDDTGSDDTGSDDTGSDDTGSDDTGSDDTGSDDTGSDDTGSDDTGDSDTDDSARMAEPED